MGAFDHLIPAEKVSPEARAGAFDHLIPKKAEKPRKRSAVEEVTGFMANVNRGLGVGDELAAGIATAGDVLTGKVKPAGIGMTGALTGLRAGFDANMADQRAIEDDFAARRPMTAAGARGVGMAGTALIPAGPAMASSGVGMAAARGATVGAATGYGYGMVDRGTLDERTHDANVGAMVGGALGGVVGGVGQVMTNRGAAPAKTDEELAAKVLDRRAKPNVVDARNRADAMRDAGVAPTGLDVFGERGRRLVRAVGVKTDTAGETLAANARTVSASTKPAAMVSTRGLVDEPRSSAQLADDLTQARGTAAAELYREPYASRVQIDAETASALRGDAGRSAIQRARQAAAARRDDLQMQELDSLLAANMDEFPEVSAGTLDRIRIAMSERAKTAGRRGANDIAGGLRGREVDLNNALDNVDGLDVARADFKAKSQAIDILDGKERLDVFSTDPADYANWLSSLTPEAQRANQVGIRQEILDTLGGQRASTFGSLDELATSPYVRDNLRVAMGDDVADQYIANLSARLEQTRNATFVSPNAGSRTAVLENDTAQAAKGAIDIGSKVVRGDALGLLQSTADWFTRRGVSQEQAEAVAKAMTDPAQLDRVITAIARRSGPDDARSLLQAAGVEANAAEQILSRLSLARAVGVGSAPPRSPAVEVMVDGHPEYGVGRAYGPARRPMTAGQ